ncbi:hypothetical protein GYMLUDRAFT_380156 [Collybiopsis luxurians FD-317 M1]|nr:hypothetical protein GYMLUDRAFT_380156 [Collybiopsis luxurians FD-317 M1]
MRSLLPCLVLLAAPLIHGQKIVLGNDDGWATAAIRAQYSALEDAGYNVCIQRAHMRQTLMDDDFKVVLSSPANDQSGTGTLSAPAIPLLFGPCEFDSCPQFSPAEGSDASDPKINYVNSFPVDGMNYGLQTLAPKFLGGAPDFAVSGPNIGHNTEVLVGSGTVGAARAAALAGIPSAAFSGSGTNSLSHVSYTTLESDPTSADSIAANIYAQLTVKVVDALLTSPTPGPILPSGISLNVNYPEITNCSAVSDYNFILTRLITLPFNITTDVETCGTDHLPAEDDVVNMDGCFVSVTVFEAETFLDADASTQQTVLNRLGNLISCLPSS